MFGFKKYNYDRFTKDLLLRDALMDRLGAPNAGERAPDFSARTVEGGEISLSDYRGEKNVVLTLGSGTCPFTVASIAGMNALYERYRNEDVEFLFVYVREAHPGESLPAHDSIEKKRQAAELFRDQERVEMPVLVDDLRGRIHKKYGKLPNPSYVIDKSGRIAFRSMWTRPGVIETALRELEARQRERDVEHAVVHGGEDTAIPSLHAMLRAHRALDRGGETAIRDFRREMGAPASMAVTAGRVLQPAVDYPARTVGAVALTAGVVAGGIIVGRYLRARRFHDPYQYEMENLGITRRSRPSAPGDYEAVGI